MYGISKIDTCDDVALVSFAKIPCELSVLSDIFDCFDKAGINIDMISQSAPQGKSVSLSFTCFGGDIVKALSVIKTLSGKYPQIKPLVNAGNCKIQLYGEEMRNMHGVFAHVINTLKDVYSQLELVTTSEVDISLLISSAHAHDAIIAIKNEFAL